MLSCYSNQMLTCAKGHFLCKMINMGKWICMCDPGGLLHRICLDICHGHNCICVCIWDPWKALLWMTPIIFEFIFVFATKANLWLDRSVCISATGTSSPDVYAPVSLLPTSICLHQCGAVYICEEKMWSAQSLSTGHNIVLIKIAIAVWLKPNYVHFFSNWSALYPKTKNHCCGLSTFAWKCRLSTEYLSAGHVSAIIGLL